MSWDVDEGLGVFTRFLGWFLGSWEVHWGPGVFTEVFGVFTRFPGC